jgi:hypothetical protein
MVRARLFDDLRQATIQAEASANAFAAITGDTPSGLPHPDGVQRIHNASNEMKLARDGMMKAHNRLNDYPERGIVPEDLKGAAPFDPPAFVRPRYISSGGADLRVASRFLG